MKKSTKISAIVFVLISLVAFSLFSFKEKNDDTSETVIVKCTQIATLKGKKSAINIYHGKEYTENVELKPYTLENELDNYDVIATTLNRLNTEGYEIVSCSETTFGDNGFVNTFILKKK